MTPAVGEQVHRLGRVLGEDDLVGLWCTNEPRDRRACFVDEVIGFGRQLIGASIHTCGVVAVVVVHGLEHGAGLLRGRSRVEVDDGLAVDLAIENRKVRFDRRDIERHEPALTKESNPSASIVSTSSMPPLSTIAPLDMM